MKKIFILLLASLVFGCATTGPTQKDLQHRATVERLQPEASINVWMDIISTSLSEVLGEQVEIKMHELTFMDDLRLAIIYFTMTYSKGVVMAYAVFNIRVVGWDLLHMAPVEKRNKIKSRSPNESKGMGNEEL